MRLSDRPVSRSPNRRSGPLPSPKKSKLSRNRSRFLIAAVVLLFIACLVFFGDVLSSLPESYVETPTPTATADAIPAKQQQQESVVPTTPQPVRTAEPSPTPVQVTPTVETEEVQLTPPESVTETPTPTPSWTASATSTETPLPPQDSGDQRACPGYNFVWRSSDLHPFVRDYIEKYILVVILTDNARGYKNLDAAWCTWLRHVPESNIVISTNHIGEDRGDRPGTWIEAPVESTEDLSPKKGQKGTTLPRSAEWYATQSRFYSTLKAGLQLAWNRTDTQRWVLLIHDDTFISFNELVPFLHFTDMKGLYDRTRYVRAHLNEEHITFRFAARCRDYAVWSTGNTSQMMCKCLTAPKKLIALLETAQSVAPEAKTDDDLLKAIGYSALRATTATTFKKMNTNTNVNTTAYMELWEESLSLLETRVMRDRYIPYTYITRIGTEEAGHFITVSSRKRVNEVYHEHCTPLVKERQMTADTAMRHCASKVFNAKRDPKLMCSDGVTVHPDERCLGPGGTWNIRRGRMFSLRLKQLMEGPSNVVARKLSLYYQALYQRNATAIDIIVRER